MTPKLKSPDQTDMLHCCFPLIDWSFSVHEKMRKKGENVFSMFSLLLALQIKARIMEQ